MTLLDRVARSATRRILSPQVYIVSYPKTGRTWLRAMMGRAISQHFAVDENEIVEVFDITRRAGLLRTELTHDGSAMLRRRSFRELSPDKSSYRRTGVILLSRDTRDTLVSAYFQATKRIHVYDGDIADFVRSDEYGARKIAAFYRHWYEARHVPREFLFLSYEEMHKNAPRALGQVLSFIGATDVPHATLEEAVEHCAFERMRKAERDGEFSSHRMRTKDVNDAEAFKMRKGKVGGFREYLSEADVEYVDRILDEEGCAFTPRAER